jgi:hypothetical protein
MAVNLKNKLGQIYSTSEEEAKKLVSDANLITPQGVAGVGANKDQAKMAGTKAQKEATLGPSLSERLRVGPAQPLTPTAESQEVERGRKLAGLSGMESRVDELKGRLLQEQVAAPVDGHPGPTLFDLT